MDRKYQGLAPGLGRKNRLAILKVHRLIVFELTFDAYLRGEVNAAQVKERALKMKEFGLPSNVK